MEEQKAVEPRATEVIQPEYTNAAAKLGDVEFKIACLKGDANNLKQQMHSLAQEAAAFKQKQEEQQPKEEA